MSAAATISVRVVRKRVEAEGICSFELASLDGAPLPPFSAGSHIDVHLPGGLTRQYSLCNEAALQDRYLIAVLRDAGSRGGSIAMHDSVHEGDEIRISEPRNHFALAHGAQRSLLMAGGIGITPILCMAERLSATGSPFDLHYSTRSRERTAFIDRIGASAFAGQVHWHFDDGAPEQKLDIAALLATPEPGTHLYVCGPQGYIDAVRSAAGAAGWPDDHVHFEFFSATPTATAGDGAFELQLAASGRVITVAADQTAMQALQAAGVEIAYSCEQGVCGTCLTRVLQGEPDHRDMYLTPEEQAANDQFTPCCSRAKSARLVLDL